MWLLSSLSTQGQVVFREVRITASEVGLSQMPASHHPPLLHTPLGERRKTPRHLKAIGEPEAIGDLAVKHAIPSCLSSSWE